MTYYYFKSAAVFQETFWVIQHKRRKRKRKCVYLQSLF